MSGDYEDCYEQENKSVEDRLAEKTAEAAQFRLLLVQIRAIARAAENDSRMRVQGTDYDGTTDALDFALLPIMVDDVIQLKKQDTDSAKAACDSEAKKRSDLFWENEGLKEEVRELKAKLRAKKKK